MPGMLVPAAFESRKAKTRTVSLARTDISRYTNKNLAYLGVSHWR